MNKNLDLYEQQDLLKEKKLENWEKVKKQLENENIQQGVSYFTDKLRNDMLGYPPLAELISIIIGFYARIQYESSKHGVDDLNALSSGKYAYELNKKAYEKRTIHDDLVVEWYLNQMPSGFKNYYITPTGFLKFNDRLLTLRKAKEFVNFLASEKFNYIMNKIDRLLTT